MRAWAAAFAVSQPTKFAFTVNLFTLVCATSFTSVMYGFNVWINDIFAVFYDTQAYDTQNGSIVYIFSGATLASSLASFAVGPYVTSIGILRTYGIAIATMVAGLLLSALAIDQEQLWLLAIAMPMYGAGAGIAFLCILPCLVWFKQTGHAGLGTGLCGFSMGLWPAAFSFYGSSLEESLGISGSMCVAAGIVTSVSLLAYVSIGIVYVPSLEPGVSIQMSSRHSELGGSPAIAAADGEAQTTDTAPTDQNSGTKSRHITLTHPSIKPTASISVMTQRQILTSKAWILLWLNFLFCLLPDFGVKYMIAPLLETTFRASPEHQTLASAIFLVVYAVARLVTGIASKYLRPKLVYLGMLALQLFGFCMSALIIREAGSMELFIAAQSFVGFCMGANKVIFYLLSFECFGAANFGIVVPSLATAYGAAAFLGPFCSWQTLRGFVPGDAGGASFDDSNTEIYFWISAGCTLISMIIAVFLKPIDVEQLAQEEEALASSEDHERRSTWA